MKRTLLFYSILVVMLAGCSTQYKTTQTPDDVYYSPAPPETGDKTAKKNNREEYQSYYSADDQYLRMKVNDRNRWSTIDDYSYWYDTRYNGFTGNYNNYYLSNGYNHCSCNCYGNSIFYPGYYNPYIGSFYTGYNTGYPYSNIYVINPKVIHPNVNRPQLGSYSNNNSSSYSTGGSIKKIFSSSSRNYNSSDGNYRSTNRTYAPSSSGSSGNASKSSGGSVSRPGRN